MTETFPIDSPFIMRDARRERWAIPYHYEALNSRVENLLVGHRDAIRNCTVLDLGCHFGSFAYATLFHGASFVHGIDSDGTLISAAKSLFTDAGVPGEKYRFDCDTIVPFLERQSPGSFDTVLCLGVFYYLNDPVHALTLMKKAARRHIILDTFTAYFAACMSKDGERVFNSVRDETFGLPVVFYPQTQSQKQDYTIPTGFTSGGKTRLSMLALPTEAAMEGFFDLLKMRYRKIRWDAYRVNSRNWKEFMDPVVKKESHWADIYHAGIRVSYIIEL